MQRPNGRRPKAAYPFRAKVKYQTSISSVSESRLALEGYISSVLMCMNIPEPANFSTMLRSATVEPLSDRFTGLHSNIQFELASAVFLSGIVESGFWPGCHSREDTPPTLILRMLQVVSLAKSMSWLRSLGNVESSTVRASSDLNSVSFSLTRRSNALSSEATFRAESSSLSNASFSSPPARIESTSGITSKSPTTNVTPVTISLRCLDSQNLRRACSIMMGLLLITTGNVCERKLKREVSRGSGRTLTDAGAFQSYFSDIRYLL